MPFKPGRSGNPSGKPRGAKNKVPNMLRANIVEFLSTEFDNVKETYKKMKPAEQLKFYTDLMQYGLPKLQSASIEIDFDKLNDEQLDEIIERLKSTL